MFISSSCSFCLPTLKLLSWLLPNSHKVFNLWIISLDIYLGRCNFLKHFYCHYKSDSPKVTLNFLRRSTCLFLRILSSLCFFLPWIISCCLFLKNLVTFSFIRVKLKYLKLYMKSFECTKKLIAQLLSRSFLYFR